MATLARGNRARTRMAHDGAAAFEEAQLQKAQRAKDEARAHAVAPSACVESVLEFAHTANLPIGTAWHLVVQAGLKNLKR